MFIFEHVDVTKQTAAITNESKYYGTPDATRIEFNFFDQFRELFIMLIFTLQALVIQVLEFREKTLYSHGSVFRNSVVFTLY